MGENIVLQAGKRRFTDDKTLFSFCYQDIDTFSTIFFSVWDISFIFIEKKFKILP